MRTWGGRFSEGPDPTAADFGRSIEVDQTLALDDLTASAAHARALGRAGILTESEAVAIEGGLEALRSEILGDTFTWDPNLEDVHMNVEAALEARIGAAAQKLHTGRSRNDQVSTDLRLWLRRSLGALDARIVALERALVRLATRHPNAVMPAHTHTQPAQPVLFTHHLLCHVEMLERDRGRIADAGRRANVSPLGSGAIAGSGFALDREAVAIELGFDGVTRNSIDASGDRDFVVESLAAFALAMVHLSRLAEEIVWWSHPSFGFVSVAEQFTTGSSMLPNKRNPDPVELVRGRAARVIGQLTTVVTLLKGLPIGYQRDLQEDKPALFDAAATLDASLAVMARVMDTLKVDEARMKAAAMQGHTTAVALADVLVEFGVPFRSAHHVVGNLVREAETGGMTLAELPNETIAAALIASSDECARSLANDAGTTERLRAAASIEGSMERCDVVGGTAPARVAAELATTQARLKEEAEASPESVGFTISAQLEESTND